MSSIKLFSVSLTGRIYWKIHRDDPELLQLNSLPSWFFVNPLIYPQVALRHETLVRVVLIVDDVAVLETNSMIFATRQNEFNTDLVPFDIEIPEIFRIETANETGNRLGDVIIPYSQYLARNLRQISKQVAFPTEIIISTPAEISRLPPLKFPTVNLRGGSMLKKYIWDTAVTWDHLIKADMELITPVTPVFEKLLLDAVHAFIEKDYRRTLLYSAISIETLAATKLENIYGLIVQNQGVDQTLRFISFKIGGGSLVRKDPVYKFLASKGKFAQWLHEIPLYLIGRSLLDEDEQLYQTALKLYRTRNKIAHLGEPTTTAESTFGMTEEDARKALECVRRVSQWFDEEVVFPFIGFGFVQGDSGELN